MRILIADDQPEVRRAIKILLEHEFELELIDEVDNINLLINKVKEMESDLLLLDWELSANGIPEIIEKLKAHNPGLLIFALSGRPEAKATAMVSSIDGFVSKGENSDRFLYEIRKAIGEIGR